MKKFRKSIAIVLSVLMILSVCSVTVNAADESAPVIRGTLPNCDWNGTYDAENTMTNDGGVYSITYDSVAAGSYLFKVVDGEKWIGTGPQGDLNIAVNVSAVSDLIITYDKAKEEISFSGANVSAPEGVEINSMCLAGELTAWFLEDAPKMTETTKDVYEITLKNVKAGEYNYKFAANGSWDVNWGASKAAGTDNEALSGNAAFDGGNFTLNFTGDAKDVTFKLDISKFNYESKTGAVYEVTLSDTSEETTVPEEETTEAPEGTTAAPVEEETTEAPEGTTAAPVEEETTEAPVEETTAAPDETTTPEKPIVPGFYVVGSEEVCGVEWGWEAPWKYNEPMKLSADGQTYYQVFENIKASAGNETDEGYDMYVFKVVYVDEQGNITWHPGGFGNNTSVYVHDDDSIVFFQFYLLSSRPTKEGTDPEAVVASVYGPEDEKPEDFYKAPYPGDLDETTAAVKETTAPPEGTTAFPEGTTAAPNKPTGPLETGNHRKHIADIVNLDEKVKTNSYMFYVPEEWRNEYNDYYYYNTSTKKFDGDGGYFAAGTYWWDGPYNCNDYKGDLENSWPGYAVTETVDGNSNIFRADIPKDVEKMIWNNLVDGGSDYTNPRFTAAFCTTDIGLEYYAPNQDGYGFYPDGVDSFDGMIYVCNPRATEENPLTQRRTYKGAWFYYYGNGEYGIYKTRKEAAENKAVYKDGVFPGESFYINKSVINLKVGDTDTITSSKSDVTVSVANPDIASIECTDDCVWTVKGLKQGETKVTFTWHDNSNEENVSEVCLVNVSGKEGKTPESITVEDMELTEGLDSYVATDDETGKLYNRYNLYPKYVIHYSDGSTDEREYDSEYDEDGGFYFETDQSVDNEWTPGVHKVKAYYGELETEFNVKINPSPVESVDFKPTIITEGLDLRERWIYDEEDEEVLSYYYRYYLEYTVKFRDGTVAESDEDEDIWYNGRYYHISYNDDQTADNRWEVGDHKVDAIILGYKTNFTVTLKENPIKKVTVNDISIIKDTNIYIDDDDYPTGIRYCYDPEYTVTLKDGTEIKSEDGYISLDGKRWYEMEVEDDQYRNEWKELGTYKAKGHLFGETYEFNVNIIESPVKEIKTSTLELIEGEDGYYSGGDKFSYFVYEVRVPDFTVVLNNGDELKPDEYNYIYYKGAKYKALTDEEHSNWKVGETYKAKFSVMGKDVDFDVKIVSSPVEKIEVEPIEVIEGADINYWYDENNPIYRVTADNYNLNKTKVKCKVTLKDGKVLESNENDEIVYNGRKYKITTDSDLVQEKGSFWTVGNSYDITVYALGKSAKATVKVVPTPVEKIVIPDLQVKLNEDGTWRYYYEYDDDDDENEIRWFNYDTEAPLFRVILKDGTVLMSENIQKIENSEGDVYNCVEYNGTYYGVTFSDNQNYKNPWGLGEHEAELNVLGFTQKYKVIVKEELDPTEPFTEPVVTPSEPTNPEVKPTEPAEKPTESNIDNPDKPSDNSDTVTSKKANPIKVTVKTKTVKAKKLKKKAQKVKAITVKKAKGKVTYKLSKVPKKIKKFVKINSKGVITVKKWKKAKKGLYKIKVKIRAKGNKKYKAKTINKIVKIRIK